MRKVLVTTAIEETWPEDPKTPVLFLGEWCRRYSRKDRWSSMSAEVLPYHWDDRQKFYRDYLYLRDFYERTLAKLSKRLNELHNVDHSLRYWRILIGPWLGRFLQIFFDRWSSLQQVLNQQIDLETIVLDYPLEAVIPQNMINFIQLNPTDLWNHYIYANIVNGLYKNKIHINYKKITVSSVNKRNEEKNFFNKMKKSFSDRILIFSKHNQFFLIDTYLPKLVQWELDLKLGQMPQWNYLIETEDVDIDEDMRNTQFDFNNQNIFEKTVEMLLIKQIPVTYLEGYFDLQKKVEGSAWPKSPKVIWTSNSDSADDCFKVYAAERVEQGAKLVIGQHGGHYGIGLRSSSEEHHLAIADRYFSWGWSDLAYPNICPIGNFKNCRSKGLDHSKANRLLLVTCSKPLYSYQLYSGPVSRQWLDYLDDQFNFCECLSDTLKKQLTVRLYAHDYGLLTSTRWQDRFPDIKLDHGETAMLEKIKECRIYVSTYNATTYLESFTMNVPTVIFWNPNHWEIRKSAKPYFEALEEVGIFHTTPQSAAKHVSQVWGDVNDWWLSVPVQEIVEAFKRQYSRMPKNILAEIHKELVELRDSPSDCLRKSS